MLLISWNVNRRVKALRGQTNALGERNPDLVALQEVTTTTAATFRDALQDMGLRPVQSGLDLVGEHPADPYYRYAGVLIASRWPVRSLPPRQFDIPWPNRVLSVILDTPWGNVEAHTAYLPLVPEVQARSFEGIFDRLGRPFKLPRILCGDFNAPREETGDGVVRPWLKRAAGAAAELSVLRGLATRAADNTVILAAVYLVGGQDELVYDGGSAVFDERGNLLARAKLFEEDLLICDLEPASVFRSRLHDPRWRNLEHLAGAGRGPDRGWVPVVLPGPNAGGTAGAAITPGALTLPSPKGRGVLAPLPLGEGRVRAAPEPSLEEEVYRALVLGTGDYLRKNGFTEVVIGLSGGIDSSLVAAIAVDAVGKERVHGVSMPSRYSSSGSLTDAGRLAENLGIDCLTIPIEPAFGAYLEMLAEPRPDQKDEDSLPPYAVLDPILKGYVEDDLSADDLAAEGHDPATVARVIGLVDRGEYKRRQAPPGVKITPRAFGCDRRLPTTNRYRPAP